ncbi:MAG: DUF1737 domain-containing protein [Rhizobiales bacterium]|nr:DUF1737 domain-containing protein [Hyphomicrobiales bacterium]NRB12995.1 DUF1737 domain-containing protein [Hyphomicrobiales bacterium]
MTDVKVKKNYRFITGTDDDDFCQRVSDALDNGYVLYGEPKLANDGKKTICAQAVVLKEKL